MTGDGRFCIEFWTYRPETVEKWWKIHRGGPIRQENGVGRHWIRYWRQHLKIKIVWTGWFALILEEVMRTILPTEQSADFRHWRQHRRDDWIGFGTHDWHFRRNLSKKWLFRRKCIDLISSPFRHDWSICNSSIDSIYRIDCELFRSILICDRRHDFDSITTIWIATRIIIRIREHRRSVVDPIRYLKIVRHHSIRQENVSPPFDCHSIRQIDRFAIRRSIRFIELIANCFDQWFLIAIRKFRDHIRSGTISHAIRKFNSVAGLLLKSVALWAEKVWCS